MGKQNKDNTNFKTDYLYDVITAVEIMDAKRLNKEDFSKDHAKAKKAVEVANNFNYPGYISISKARNLIQAQFVNAKVRAKEAQANMQNAVKRGQVPKKSSN